MWRLVRKIGGNGSKSKELMCRTSLPQLSDAFTARFSHVLSRGRALKKAYLKLMPTGRYIAT